MSSDPGRVRTLRGLVALCAIVAGCAAPVAYQPNEAALDGMKRDQREQLFVETLSRAAKPRILQVWIDDASYGYDSAQAVRDGFGVPVGYTGRRRIVFFANVRELQLYDNGAVFVIDTTGRTVDKIRFAYPDDAQRMMDLIAAYRARRYAGASAPRDEPDHRNDRRHDQRREWAPPPYDQRYGVPPQGSPPPYDQRYGVPPQGSPPPNDQRYGAPPQWSPPPNDQRYDEPPPGWYDRRD